MIIARGRLARCGGSLGAVGLADQVLAVGRGGRADAAQRLLGGVERDRGVGGEQLAQLLHARLGVVDDLGGEAGRERLVGSIVRAVKTMSFSRAGPSSAAGRA